MRPRAIIHLNIADFAARLETMGSAALRDRPVVIAPLGAPRAVVYDMNEPAFREGIRKRMSLSQVLSRHRGIRVLPPRFNRYANAMKEIARLGLAVTPAVESGMGDGHLFLDITDTTRLYGPGPDVAFRLKKTIKRQMGLDSVWSLATNKLVAKAATRLVKPLGEYIVGPGEEADFLASFPLKLLPGIRRREARTAARFNLETVSHLRQLTPAQLAIPFAERAYTIHRIIQGIDTNSVGSGASAQNPAAGPAPDLVVDHEFATDTNDRDELKACVALLSRQLSRALARSRASAGRLVLSLSYADGIRIHGSCTRIRDNTLFMFRAVWTLFVRTWKRRVRIRHISLACSARPAWTDPSFLPVQADLFQAPARDSKAEKISKVQRAAGRISGRFGPEAITLGAALNMPGKYAVS
jgi:DNA polymerase-4